MKKLWNYIDAKDWKEKTKYKAVLWILGILSALAGFAVWLVAGIWGFRSPDWMLCLIGYPVVLSVFIIVFYSCRHNFHNGAVQNAKRTDRRK